MSINKDRLISRFNDIEEAINRLEQFLTITKDEFLKNSDYIHIARSHLLIASESVIAICYHLSSKILKKAPISYSKCFEMINERGILSKELCSFMKKIVGLRNKMVHRYEEIDYGFVYDNIRDIIINLQKLIYETTLTIEKTKQ